MNSFNSIGSYLQNVGSSIINYIYNFPAVDASLVLYYPLDSSGSRNTVANYASGLPVYDASLSTSAIITTSKNLFVTGLGDLSLNNTMGSTATSYVKSYTSFNLVPSRGLSISLWFSCSGQLDTSGTLISLYQKSIDSSIDIGVFTNTLYSGYFIPVPVTFSFTGGGSKSATNSPNGNVNYIFTSDGTFTVTGNSGCTIKVLLVGAGGKGGDGICSSSVFLNGGGGGAGEYIETGSITIYNTTTFNITIGSNYNSGQTIFDTYTARKGGNGASFSSKPTFGGGGSSYSSEIVGGGFNTSRTGASGYNGRSGGNGVYAGRYSGGGGAGAGSNGDIGRYANSPSIFDNGGDGITPSTYFINNTYCIGGPTRMFYTSNLSTTSGTLWRVSYTDLINGGIDAPNNTGYGGIGGTQVSIDPIAGYLGGSGICIVSIV